LTGVRGRGLRHAQGLSALLDRFGCDRHREEASQSGGGTRAAAGELSGRGYTATPGPRARSSGARTWARDLIAAAPSALDASTVEEWQETDKDCPRGELFVT
jgi:hypothetical protein